MPDAPATLPGRRLHREAGLARRRDVRVVATLGLRARLLGATAGDRLWGWLGPLIVAAVGGFLRFWNLDQPHQLVFDETYYVKQGYSYLKAGYELAWNGTGKDVDALFTKGNLNVFKTGPDFVVHPPVGKWMIAFGERLFGPESSWGWRFSVAVVGTLSIFMIGRIARRLFGSTLLGTTAALLLAVDGQHFVHSRTSILDLFIMFWALAGFGCLLVDRDRARQRLADLVEAGTPVGSFGPRLWWRPWRLAAVVCLALCAGVKWSGAFFLAAFLLMSVLWDLGARRALRARRWFAGGVLLDALPTAVVALPLALATYLATWVGWFRSTNAWDRQWGVQHPSSTWEWVPASLRGLWHYHAEMWRFNVTLHSPHPYQSNPWSWTVLGRPTAFFYEGSKNGEGACHVAVGCSKAIMPIGNPVIWWGATIGVAVLLVCWALGRDWRAGAVLAGLAAGWLPWFHWQDRTIYTFYAVAFVPWVVLTVTYCLGLLLGKRNASPERRLYGGIAAGAVVVLAVALFVWFYPVYTGQLIPQPSWADRMWLPSWV
jgi:dolichyl-phosphate-mannose-protein mannosyltransferase